MNRPFFALRGRAIRESPLHVCAGFSRIAFDFEHYVVLFCHILTHTAFCVKMWLYSVAHATVDRTFFGGDSCSFGLDTRRNNDA